MNLDVGCGVAPKGNVNLDILIDRETYIPNLVKGDIHFLPFRSKGFENTFCYHVLEHHGVKIVSAIREMLRVTKNILEIEIPHRMDGFKTYHATYFGVLSFKTLLRSLSLPFTFDVSHRCFPHNFLCLMKIPHRIRVRISCGV